MSEARLSTSCNQSNLQHKQCKYATQNSKTVIYRNSAKGGEAAYVLKFQGATILTLTVVVSFRNGTKPAKQRAQGTRSLVGVQYHQQSMWQKAVNGKSKQVRIHSMKSNGQVGILCKSHLALSKELRSTCDGA
eukprot:6213587-Pleurochrysis_carterae.AAC.3